MNRERLILDTDNKGNLFDCFEVAWLDAHNRIQLPCKRTNWFEKALEGSNIKLLTITPAIAGLAVDLPDKK